MSERQETPRDFPETTPPRPVMTDYSLTLQAIIELQKNIGQLTERINTLIGRVDKQGDTLTTISRNIFAAWVVLAVFLTVGGFLINKLWPGLTKLLEQVLRNSR